MDTELEELIRREALERSARITQKLATLSEELARSLDDVAVAFERVAAAQEEAESCRQAFRRAECPGYFD